ncbi:MAG: hypothetical protein JOS17DRAFT_780723 [Linnemannia elongata]|nr:MAG: hypothetical protein JOS17DRAFT_780723 [Linnemannia elongata]
MPWNPFATGAAVLAGALALGVSGISAASLFLVAAKTGVGVIVVLQAIEATCLSVIRMISSITGGVTARVITAIAMREDSDEHRQPAIANPTGVNGCDDLVY